MKTCPYCASELQAAADLYYCSFCCMKGMTPAEDGGRRSRYTMKFSIGHEDLEKTTPELMLYHTFDLLRLLKFLRDERRSYYHNIKTLRKAGEMTEEFKQLEQEVGGTYEQLTRKTWIVENILKDRIGYIPQKVTDQLLATVEERAEHERNHKLMVIRKARESVNG